MEISSFISDQTVKLFITGSNSFLILEPENPFEFFQILQTVTKEEMFGLTYRNSYDKVKRTLTLKLPTCKLIIELHDDKWGLTPSCSDCAGHSGVILTDQEYKLLLAECRKITQKISRPSIPEFVEAHDSMTIQGVLNFVESLTVDELVELVLYCVDNHEIHVANSVLNSRYPPDEFYRKILSSHSEWFGFIVKRTHIHAQNIAHIAAEIGSVSVIKFLIVTERLRKEQWDSMLETAEKHNQTKCVELIRDFIEK